MSDIASKTSYSASAITTVVGGFNLNEVVALVGIALAVGTFLVNWRYKHLHYKIEKARLDETS
jgi:hypothetical protein